MFDNLSTRLAQAVRDLTGRGRLTDSNIKETLRQVRLALLEADVALPVVKSFVENVRAQAVGREVATSLTPGQALVRIIHRELVKILGGAPTPLTFKAQPPVVILLVGLQGTGKTTTAAKLAKRFIEAEKKRVMLTSVDVHRPAAVLQLETLADRVGAMHFRTEGESAEKIMEGALDAARRAYADIVIVDTAGRLHVDEAMMTELERVYQRSNAHETLYVLDCMAGQDAVNAARTFGQTVTLTGIILTKADGDARGGAALSVSEITGKPIRFLGVGEKLDALEVFHADRMASRILGMGDLGSLVENIQDGIPADAARSLSDKLNKGRGYDLSDLKDQLQQMLGLGGIAGLLDKLPMPGNIDRRAVKARADDKQLKRQIAIIDSMTPHERHFPKVINGSRKRRIAAGSGTRVQDVNRLLKQHMQMQKMMKKASRGGLRKMIRGLGGGAGPPFGTE